MSVQRVTRPLSLRSQWAAPGRRCTSCRDAVKPSGWNSTLQQEEIAYLCVAKGDRKQCVGNSTGIELPMAHRASRMNNKAFSFTFFVVLLLLRKSRWLQHRYPHIRFLLCVKCKVYINLPMQLLERKRDLEVVSQHVEGCENVGPLHHLA